MNKSTIKNFLSLHLKEGAKLLLGLSGGPDSMALLYFLLEYRRIFDFSLHLAHVDHGWRKESKKEAQTLQHLASQLKLPFYLHTLRDMMGPDLENRCRQRRLEFFERLHQEHHYQALLLAHHGGDQAETVLKRVFEGAGLKALGGLYPVRSWDTLTLWRPLLSYKKEELISYLNQRQLPYFEDPTNSDTAYLRSKMREEIFPKIERQFGKNIQKNCMRLGAMCQELSQYFEEKSQKIEEKLIKGPFGDCLPLVFHPVELKYFFKRYAQGAHLSSEALDLLIRLIQQKRNSLEVPAPPLTFYINQNYIFILRKPFPSFLESIDKWRIIEKGAWQSFWQGKIAIPKGDIQMERLSNLEPRLKKKIKKWYASHHVPSFFYERAPIFLREGKVAGECLTGLHLNY